MRFVVGIVLYSIPSPEGALEHFSQLSERRSGPT
jgi:hypothetical protein